MGLVLRTPLAEEDMVGIWRYISQGDPRQADRFFDKLHDTAETLAEFPSLGNSRPELGANVRSHPVDRYVVYFRAMDDGIEILRVFSAYRDILTAWR
ncbi:MAG: type II toxin-antitoxin system RelE/ParE family toxin [Phycisphaerae bacterium]|nr:type II toxin-antitoxin system RelE/ParE family toxin [Planctomycetia bacterium]MCL4720042.1 type II toxin-antitoxin system RelE/ParE family toxin [Phycisphaerae bacterium]